MIIRSRTVATMERAPITDGAVLVEDERISDVGKFSDVRARHGGEVLDLGEQILLPGLINAHCHLDYTCLRNTIPRQPTFTDWIRAINAEKARLAPDDYVRSIEDGFSEAQKFGTTSIVNLAAFPELIPRVRDPLRTWWCAEVIDVRPGTDAEQLVTSAREQMRAAQSALARAAFAPHAPYTASRALYRAAEREALRGDLVCTTHVAESFEETQMFQFGSGALHDFLARIGRDMSDCGGVTAFAAALRLCSAKARWIFAHCNEMTDDDYALLARSESRHIVHCPRSHDYFQHARFADERLRDAGANICIGTDSLASAPNLSLLAELRAFRGTRPHVSAFEALELVTRNPARALGVQDQLGRIATGSLADLIAVPFTGAARDAYEAIVAFEGQFDWSMLNGRGASSI